MKTQVFLIVLILASSCAGLDGLFEQRTFIDQMDHQTDGYFVPGENFNVVPGDGGQAYRSRRDINHRTPANIHDKKEDQYERSINRELAEKEKKLSPREYRRYMENSEYYPSESEKIYFLSLSRSDRREYLENKGAAWSGGKSGGSAMNTLAAAPSFENKYNNYVDSMTSSTRDLVLGMDKKRVIGTWGRPARIDVAGDPSNQNERWSFFENGRVKVVYFESGQVQGWAID
jgi:hypothetical protein